MLSGPGETKVSKNGMDPLLLRTSSDWYVWVNGVDVV